MSHDQGADMSTIPAANATRSAVPAALTLLVFTVAVSVAPVVIAASSPTTALGVLALVNLGLFIWIAMTMGRQPGTAWIISLVVYCFAVAVGIWGAIFGDSLLLLVVNLIELGLLAILPENPFLR
jgi:hypothetical protein